MMVRGAQLGRVILGAYLASVGTVLATGAGGSLRDLLDVDSRWDLPVPHLVGIGLLVLGAGLIVSFLKEIDRPVSSLPSARPLGERAQAEGQPGTQSPGSSAVSSSLMPAGGTRRAVPGGLQDRQKRTRDPNASGSVVDGSGPARSGFSQGVDSRSAGPRSGSPIPDVPASQAVTGPAAELQPSAELSKDDLIRCWRRYLAEGDGHFRADGLRAELAESGFRVAVMEGRDVGAGDHVLVVPTGATDGTCYVVPSFAKSPRAVEGWFDDRGDGGLSRRVGEVVDLAEGRRTVRGIELVRKGAVT